MMESPSESPSKWYPLPHFPTLPALLVSARFGETSYTLHVTDLANVWVEKLDRRGILLRSLQENTSIDLVDADPEQWAVFLSKLKAAFDPTSPDHRLTRLGIATATEPHSKNRDGLTLRITCELPHPLNALKWPVHLVKCQPASLASELVLPLIQEHYIQSREAEDLMSQLKEKDAIITRLLDKLSTMHAPLELIFNSLSAKHAITRAAAEERIKGLAPFDEEKWRSQRNVESPQNALSLLHSVFSGRDFSQAKDTELGISETLNDWWTKLSSEFHTASEFKTGTTRQKPKEKVSDIMASSEDVEEHFQVQITPRHRLSRSPTTENSKKEKAIHEATDSNGSDGPDSPSMRSRNRPHFRIGRPGNMKMPAQDPAVSQSSRTLQADDDETASETEDEEQSESSTRTGQPKARLGTIGRPKQPSQTTRPATTTDLSADANDETAPGSDSDSDGSPKPQRSSTRAPTTPRKGALGRIGGKSKATATALVNSPHDAASDDSALSKKTEVGKIGAIGHKPHKDPKKLHSDAPVEPEELETDEQKAERKRAELEKELNKKSTVPARKKRKF
ncbi:XLF-domain-containing protein [Xylaria sp. FL1777]|nr:XLF-domain-containing protein [Xylaria sp. FL1777]